MERRGFRCAALHDERAQGFELRVTVVDRLLQLANAPLVDARLLQLALHFVAIGGRQQGADGEQIALQGHEDLIDARHHLDAARQAKRGVQLVHVAVRLDARMRLRHAATAEQARLTGVTGARIDLHGFTCGGTDSGARRVRADYPNNRSSIDLLGRGFKAPLRLPKEVSSTLRVRGWYVAGNSSDRCACIRSGDANSPCSMTHASSADASCAAVARRTGLRCSAMSSTSSSPLSRSVMRSRRFGRGCTATSS